MGGGDEEGRETGEGEIEAGKGQRGRGREGKRKFKKNVSH